MKKPKPFKVGDRVLIIWKDHGEVFFAGVLTFIDEQKQIVRVYGKYKGKHASKKTEVAEFSNDGKHPALSVIHYR